MPHDELVLFCAFRYALGRMTYVVQAVAKELVLQKNKITPYMKGQIVGEITDAIAEKRAGARMDVQEWEKVLVAFGYDASSDA